MTMTASPAPRRPLSSAAWWADDEAADRIEVRLARTFADYDAAFRLVHDQYVRRGFVAAEPSGRRVGVHALLPSTKVLVAAVDGRLAGTLTLIEDSRLGLPMDLAFARELGRLRARGRRIAETGALALAPACRRQSAAILTRLFRVAALHLATIARADDMCFIVHPRHQAFYRSLFPFEEFPERRPYAPIRGVPPATGFRADLGLVRAVVRVERSGLSAGPLYRFLFGPAALSEVTRQVRRDLAGAALTPPEWALLFAPAGEPAPGRSGARDRDAVNPSLEDPNDCR
jgi:GNAT superfamily N-acetyltransferase